AGRLRRVEGAAAREDCEPGEEALLVRAEEVVAPVERRPERLLVLGGVAAAAGEEREPVPEPRQKRHGRQELRPRGGELDREREPVEAAAELGDDGRVLLAQGG